MLFAQQHKWLLITIFLSIFISGCSITAPVQEMSNARQSIQAAKDAHAENFAKNILTEARRRLASAMRELDAGEYENARILALEAKHLALKARQLATSKKLN